MTGLKPFEFRHLFTPSELFYWFKGKGRDKDYLFDLAAVGWNVNRWAGSQIYNINRGKGKYISPQRQLSLPGDRKIVDKLIDPQDTTEMLRKGNKVMKLMMN